MTAADINTNPGEAKMTMKQINCGETVIDVTPAVFDALIACARVGCEGAYEAISEELADAVWVLLNKMEEAA